MRWWSRRRPRCCSKAENRTTPKAMKNPGRASSRLPCVSAVAWQAAEIPQLFAEIESAVAAGRSAAGFFAYECGNCFEPKAGMRASRHGEPLAWFGIYERSYSFDHTTGRFADGEPAELERFRADRANGGDGAVEPKPEIVSKFALSEAEYARRIAAIHEWIRAGDVYQLNFTAPFRIETHSGVAALYARLRARQPVDYGAFLHWELGRFHPVVLAGAVLPHGESRRRRSTWPPYRYAPHERHRASRAHHARRPRDRRVAAQRPQKPQRKRDDRRPAAQRPGPRGPNGKRARRSSSSRSSAMPRSGR